jgi:hypothetical protein
MSQAACNNVVTSCGVWGSGNHLIRAFADRADTAENVNGVCWLQALRARGPDTPGRGSRAAGAVWFPWHAEEVDSRCCVLAWWKLWFGRRNGSSRRAIVVRRGILNGFLGGFLWAPFGDALDEFMILRLE